MKKRDYASLPDLRQAIQRRRVIRFTLRGTDLQAEPFLLGSARTTSAMVLVAYILGEGGGWATIRFHEIRDMEVTTETFYAGRAGFNPHDRFIAGIDVCALSPARPDGP